VFNRKVTLLVEPAQDGGWSIVEGNRQVNHFRRKRDATLAGREYLKHRGGGELVIRSLSGRLTERDTVPG
jgi:uncharacterized protein DUF2188